MDLSRKKIQLFSKLLSFCLVFIIPISSSALPYKIKTSSGKLVVTEFSSEEFVLTTFEGQEEEELDSLCDLSGFVSISNLLTEFEFSSQNYFFFNSKILSYYYLNLPPPTT